MHRLRPVLAVMLLALVGGCADEVLATAQPSASAATSTSRAPVVSPEDAYLADIADTPGLTSTVPDSEMVAIGQGVCGLIGEPGIPRDLLVEQIGTTKFGPEVAEVVVAAAETNLCPGRRYSTAAPVEVGPVASFGDGTWEVGVDVAAGKIKTSGAESCYWSRLTDSGGDIIDNHFGAGPQTVTIRAGELFESQGCGTWTVQ